jgi:hypothetical protein
VNVQRRDFLLATLTAVLPTAATAGAAPSDLKAAAREVWLYGLPLIEFARVRNRGVDAGGAPAGPSINRFSHNRDLVGPEARRVTTPNNDTLYSVAFIDLSAGPARIGLPASGARYFSLQLMDAYTNSFAVLGTRTTGPDGGEVVLQGPTSAAGSGDLRAPTPWVWAIGRTLASGIADLGAARQIQDQLTLAAPAPGETPPLLAGRDADWPTYFAAVQALMRENPPPVTDTAILARVAALGLPRARRQGQDRNFNPDAFSAGEAAMVAAGVAEARSLLARPRKPKVEAGWVYPTATLGNYGQDYVTRAAVALYGLGALPPAEAMYMRAVSPDGGFEFDGDRPWRLSFGPGRTPPVAAFWSLSLYEFSPEKQLFFTDNPIGRYAIGDRTPGLAPGPDGSLEIWIGHDDPGPGRSANWLPAPRSGPFALTMRAYLPAAELMDGRYRLPAVTPA